MNDYIYKYIAMKQCHKSHYKKRLGAVVIYNGRIVGKGFNKVHSTGVERFDGKHAEIEALKNTTAKYRSGSTVYVCRIMKNNEMAMAKPCYRCQVKMKKMGIKYVWYSTLSGWERMII